MYLKERNTPNHLLRLQILCPGNQSSFTFTSGRETSDPIEGSVWKSKNNGLPVELLSKPIKLAPVMELSRVACFVRLEQQRTKNRGTRLACLKLCNINSHQNNKNKAP